MVCNLTQKSAYIPSAGVGRVVCNLTQKSAYIPCAGVGVCQVRYQGQVGYGVLCDLTKISLYFRVL